MGNVRHEAPVLLLGGLQAADRRLERIGHPVELRRPARELVPATLRHAGTQVPGGDPARGPPGGIDWAQDPARDDAGDEQRHGDGDQPGAQQAQPELGHRVDHRSRREDEVAVRPTAIGPSAHDQHVVPAQDLEREAELPAPHERAQVRRHLGQGALQLEGGIDVPVTEVRDRLDVPAELECLGETGGGERRRIDGSGVLGGEQDGEVEVGLVPRVCDEPVAQGRIGEGVDADADRRHGHGDQGDERECEARPDPGHGRQAGFSRRSSRPCSQHRAR